MLSMSKARKSARLLSGLAMMGAALLGSGQALALTDAEKQDLNKIAYDASLPLEQRAEAAVKLTGLNGAKRTICIFDPIGKKGPVYGAAMDQRTEIMKFGIDVQLEAYTNEAILAESLKAGQCDASLMSGLRGRLFHKYAGTIDAVGAVPTDDHMRLLLTVVNSPKNAEKMRAGDYVVLGIAPAGAAYVFVNDKSINSLAAASGRKVAVLDYDPIQADMVSSVGATPISSDILSAPNKFNNGVVDVLPAPLVAYEALELYKGMEPNGGIVEMPLAQITVQMIGRADKFPAPIDQLIREGFLNGFDQIQEMLGQEAAKVPEKYWIPLPPDDKVKYETMMQEARVALRDRGYYDADMLTLQRKIRCKIEPARGECTNPVE